jgi:hypothetical protein
MRDEVGRLRDIGTDWIVFNLVGDDPAVSHETVEWFGAQIIAAV